MTAIVDISVYIPRKEKKLTIVELERKERRDIECVYVCVCVRDKRCQEKKKRETEKER